MITVEQLQNKLKKFDPKDKVWFYHLKNDNLTQCDLETIRGGFNQEDLGSWIELTIEEREGVEK